MKKPARGSSAIVAPPPTYSSSCTGIPRLSLLYILLQLLLYYLPLPIHTHTYTRFCFTARCKNKERERAPYIYRAPAFFPSSPWRPIDLVLLPWPLLARQPSSPGTEVGIIQKRARAREREREHLRLPGPSNSPSCVYAGARSRTSDSSLLSLSFSSPVSKGVKWRLILVCFFSAPGLQALCPFFISLSLSLFLSGRERLFFCAAGGVFMCTPGRVCNGGNRPMAAIS